MTAQDKQRKILEKAGLYDILCNIHESHEEEDCFCTTEIAPYYTQLLSVIEAYKDNACRELLDKIESRWGETIDNTMGKPIRIRYVDISIIQAERNNLKSEEK